MTIVGEGLYPPMNDFCLCRIKDTTKLKLNKENLEFTLVILIG